MPNAWITIVITIVGIVIAGVVYILESKHRGSDLTLAISGGMIFISGGAMLYSFLYTVIDVANSRFTIDSMVMVVCSVILFVPSWGLRKFF